MTLEVLQGSIQDTAADAVVVNLFEGVGSPGGATGALDRALGGAIAELIAAGDLKGERGAVTVLYPRGAVPATRVLIVGLGPREEFSLEVVRLAAAAAAKRARRLGAKTLATIVHGGGVGGLDPEAAAQATAEGTLLALHRYADHKRDQEEKPTVEALTLVEFDPDKLDAIRAGARAAEATAAGVRLARDLTTMPPNMATPTHMAQAARELAAEHGLTATIGDRFWAQEQGLGAFLAVAQGAGEEPAFIVLEHNAGKDLPTLALVGKGVTFDSGGLSLKTRTGMLTMKGDMGGAAAVLGAIKSLALLGLPLHVVAIAPCVENMPDAAAYRPSDVITAANGKTIEIISTDAEGRMALADALHYAARFEPDAVVDIATLTGSAMTALGAGVAAGLFANDDGLRDELMAAGERTHERLWPLPLYPDYRKTIDSRVADVKNSGGAGGGVGTSAVFLQEFVDGYAWAHVDMAGHSLRERGRGYTPAGGTGFGVRLLVEWARGRARAQA